MVEAVGYLRVSGTSQIKGDGFTRQEKAIRKYAKANKIKITKIYKEKAVKGDTYTRPAFTDMLLDLEEQESKIVLIEKLDRFARDLMIQEQIVFDMQKRNLKLISALEGPDLLKDDPTRILIRQIMGAFSQYEKAMIIQKLRGARQRIKAKTGKCEGRKSYEETHPGTLIEIKRLRRKPKNGQRLSLKKTVEALNDAGFKTAHGLDFTVNILKHIIYTKKLTAA